MAEAEVGVTQPSPKECQGLRATAETWERGSWHILTETPQKGPSRPHLGYGFWPPGLREKGRTSP